MAPARITELTEFTSDIVSLESNQEKVYNHLLVMSNYEALFPEDKISDFECTENSFSVKIAGQGRIRMEKAGEIPHEKITLRAVDDKPFMMELNIVLNSSDSEKTEGHIYAQADLNPFIKMVAQKPLDKLFNSMAQKLAKLIS